MQYAMHSKLLSVLNM